MRAAKTITQKGPKITSPHRDTVSPGSTEQVDEFLLFVVSFSVQEQRFK